MRIIHVLLFIKLFVFANLALAAPAISNVSLVSSDSGDTLEISGSGFGSGPNVVLFETFEGGTTSQVVGSSDPASGSWYKAKATYTEEDSLSGSKSALVVAEEKIMNMEFGLTDAAGLHGLKVFDEVYFSYSIKDLGKFPGSDGTPTSFSSVSATKDAWMMLGNRGDNTSYSVGSLGQESGHDIYVPAWTGAGFNIAGNETKMSPSYWQNDMNAKWSFGDWNKIMFHAKLNSFDPYGNASGFFDFVSSKGYLNNPRSGNFMTDQTSEGVSVAGWDRIKFMGWVRLDANVKRVIDDVYVAIGENANARVLVSNAPTIAASTTIHHLLPTAWEDGKITVDLSSSSIQNIGTLYVHVLDKDNQGGNSGYACTSCEDAVSPPMPPVLSVSF